VRAGLSYVEAVLWLGARLADGLAHAHERGILHRDLKPANVLLTDDGTPMLLDFNLSEDTKQGVGRAGVGGTLPYMSPEQLEAFRGGKQPVDARSDLFSIGVILYELLTRKAPFPVHRRFGPTETARMVQERRRPVPRLQPLNRSVTPAVESIVRRCLDPDPARRYQTARELKEDLERQVAHRPLRHAPDRSPAERLRKWRHRHPFLASSVTLAVAAAFLVVVLAAGFVYRGHRMDRLEALKRLERTGEAVRDAQVKLLDRNADRQELDDGARLCREALDLNGALGDPGWLASSLTKGLSAEERGRLGEAAGDLLFLLAKATAQQAVRDAARTSPDDRLREALALNASAESCYEARGVPRAIWEQRADLTRLLGRREEAAALLGRARETPPRPDKDGFLQAQLYAVQGDNRRALPLLRQATQADPGSFVAWYVRGNCHLDLLQDAEAVACFNSCVALRPGEFRTWFNRGLAHRRQRNYEQAVADFDKVVALRPDLVKGFVNRALAREGLKDAAGAAADATRAMELADAQGASRTSLFLLRSRLRKQVGDPDGAARDRAEGLKLTPSDEDGWVDRGLERVAADPKGALADFEEALKLNAQSIRGLQNKGAVLSQCLGRDPEAMRVMDEAVRHYPDSALARGGRAVLLARVGKRAEAREDAREALLLDTSPPMLYQVACVYALTSQKEAGDRVEALGLLSAALRTGYGLDFVNEDHDLEPLRGVPEFGRLVAAARALQGGRAPGP
jgi:tetratricopeptide (TPR) repeat protein